MFDCSCACLRLFAECLRILSTPFHYESSWCSSRLICSIVRSEVAVDALCQEQRSSLAQRPARHRFSLSMEMLARVRSGTGNVAGLQPNVRVVTRMLQLRSAAHVHAAMSKLFCAGGWRMCTWKPRTEKVCSHARARHAHTCTLCVIVMASDFFLCRRLVHVHFKAAHRKCFDGIGLCQRFNMDHACLVRRTVRSASLFTHILGLRISVEKITCIIVMFVSFHTPLCTHTKTCFALAYVPHLLCCLRAFWDFGLKRRMRMQVLVRVSVQV